MHTTHEERIDVMNVLIKAGSDMEIENKGGKTALIIASYWRHLNSVECLVKVGANIEAQDYIGATALYYASSLGHDNVAQYLREAGTQTM